MKKFIILIFLVFFGLVVNAQQRCGTTDYTLQLMEKYPEYKLAKEKVNLETTRWLKNNPDHNLKSIITIPVVVHVVWNTNAENISDAQILSQMDVLNDDFRRTNSDASNTPSVWQNIAADCEIDFCLATVAPNGASTTGITRTQTSQSSFSIGSDNVKSSSTGGIDPWPQDDYLNIWVCDLGGGLLGYATPPSSWTNPNDGVVIGYRYFGTTGVVQAPYNKGRTATHEVGHWLNLPHTWGSTNEPGLLSNCGSDDGVADTPNTIGSQWCNYNETTCGSHSNIENYMEYSSCRKMFTNGQKSRMRTALNSSVGGRNNLCSPTNLAATGIDVPPPFCQADFFANSYISGLVTRNRSFQRCLYFPTISWANYRHIWNCSYKRNIFT